MWYAMQCKHKHYACTCVFHISCTHPYRRQTCNRSRTTCPLLRGCDAGLQVRIHGVVDTHALHGRSLLHAARIHKYVTLFSKTSFSRNQVFRSKYIKGFQGFVLRFWKTRQTTYMEDTEFRCQFSPSWIWKKMPSPSGLWAFEGHIYV